MKLWKLTPAIIVAGMAVPAVASASGPVLPAGVSTSGTMRYAPQLAHLAPPKNTNLYSGNWAGYVDIDHGVTPNNGATKAGNFTKVTTTFQIPKMTTAEQNNCVAAAGEASDGYAEAASWVGLDGWANDTVEQDGASVYCESDGSLQSDGQVEGVYAWYEMYPADPVVYTFTGVNPGDQMTVTTAYSHTEYNLAVKDNTNGATFDAIEPCVANGSSESCENNSAEVIQEDPGGDPANGAYLADYGTVKFGDVKVNGGGQSGDLNSSSMWVGDFNVTEKYGSTIMQSTSPLSDNGGAFSDTFKAPF